MQEVLLNNVKRRQLFLFNLLQYYRSSPSSSNNADLENSKTTEYPEYRSCSLHTRTPSSYSTICHGRPALCFSIISVAITAFKLFYLPCDRGFKESISMEPTSPISAKATPPGQVHCCLNFKYPNRRLQHRQTQKTIENQLLQTRVPVVIMTTLGAPSRSVEILSHRESISPVGRETVRQIPNH
jgi:hypothetical protein